MDDLDVGEAGRPFDQGMDERLGLGGARMDVDPPARADAVHGILRRRQARAVQSSPAVHGVLLKRIAGRRASRLRSAPLDASPLPASAPTIADSGRARVRSRYAPSATRFATLTEPAFPAIAVAGRPIASTPPRPRRPGITPAPKITTPPPGPAPPPPPPPPAPARRGGPAPLDPRQVRRIGDQARVEDHQPAVRDV